MSKLKEVEKRQQSEDDYIFTSIQIKAGLMWKIEEFIESCQRKEVGSRKTAEQLMKEVNKKKLTVKQANDYLRKKIPYLSKRAVVELALEEFFSSK